MSRRLPVYVLLDCSESMIGPGIEGLRLAVDAMLKELRRNPQALDTVWLSFITFDSEARQAMPLTPVADAQTPALKVRPGTALGAALRLTIAAIRNEVKRTTVDQKGDFRPLIFLITDGQPTDEWQGALADLDTRTGTRPANLYAIGCGADVDFNQLGKITDIVLRLDNVDAAGFGKLFVWLSASVHSASMGIADADPSALVAKLPSDVSKIDLSKVPAHDGRPRQVFLRVRCVQQRRPYLMRFALDEEGGFYRAVSSHILEEASGDASGGFRLPAVDSRLLMGCPPCPYCPSDVAATCGSCDSLFCLPSRNPPSQVICPSCGDTMHRTGGPRDSFLLRQSAG